MEKNLLNPRECFSGVGAEDEDEEEADIVGQCFELIGDLIRVFGSESERLNGAVLYRCKGDSLPTSPGSIISCKLLVPLIVGSSSTLKPWSSLWMILSL